MKTENQKPKWLTELQQKSWEPEVLLSGIVLYGLFQVPALLDELVYFVKVNFSINAGDIDTFVRTMKMAIYWLTGGLIAHLISRGIWVGMVGLSFAFPKGIRQENLKHQPKFEGFVGRIPDTERIILNLESFCSSLFSVSFLLFMMMVGAYFYLFASIVIPVLTLLSFWPSLFDEGIAQKILTAYILIVLSFGFIGFIDFVTLGFFKRFRWFAVVYWPVYRFVGWFTLARFYRPIYYTFVSNVARWKLYLFVVLFVSISLWSAGGENTYPGERFSKVSLWDDTRSTSVFSGHYDDQNDDIKSVVASIQSDIIRGNTVRLFIVMHANREDSIRKYCHLDSLMKVDGLSKASARLQCVSQFYQVAINDSLLTDLTFKFHYKSKTQQRGILAYVDIRSLPAGLHHLTVGLPPDMYKYPEVAVIPFYKEETVTPYYVPVEQEGEQRETYLKLKPLLPK